MKTKSENNSPQSAYEFAWTIEQAIIDSGEECLESLTIKQLLAIRQIVINETINFNKNTEQNNE